MMTNRPVPANIKFPPVVPRNILPISRPDGSNTCVKVFCLCAKSLMHGLEGRRPTDLDSIATPCIDVALTIHLDTIWDTRVGISHHAAVSEGLRCLINIESVSKTRHRQIALMRMHVRKRCMKNAHSGRLRGVEPAFDTCTSICPVKRNGDKQVVIYCSRRLTHKQLSHRARMRCRYICRNRRRRRAIGSSWDQIGRPG